MISVESKLYDRKKKIPEDRHSPSSLACLEIAGYDPHLDIPSSDIKPEKTQLSSPILI